MSDHVGYYEGKIGVGCLAMLALLWFASIVITAAVCWIVKP